MSNFNMPKWVKILMLKGEKGDRPTITTTPIDNGTEITFSYSDGTSASVDVHNATSGDYSGLTNKPSINGEIVSGDKAGSAFGLISVSDLIILEGNVTDIPAQSEKTEKIATFDFFEEYGATEPADIVVLAVGYSSGEMSQICSWGTGTVHGEYGDYPSIYVRAKNQLYADGMFITFMNTNNYVTNRDYKVVCMVLKND